MARVTLDIPYLRRKASGFYWEPSRRLQRLGFTPHALGKDETKALERARELNELTAKEAGRSPQEIRRHGTVRWVIREAYLKSEAWAKLAPKTQSGYRRALDIIEDWAGDFPAKAVTRAAIKAKQREMEKGSKQVAAATMRVLRIIMGVAEDEGLIPMNPALRLKLATPNERNQVWTDEDVAGFCAKAAELGYRSMAFAVMLAYHLGQREGDILSLAWSQYDAAIGVIELWPRKTRKRKSSRRLAIPVSPELRVWLEKEPRVSTVMVISEATGRPYKEDHFRHLFAEIRREAELSPDLWFMDLRRTVATQIGAAGGTEDEIRAITGHTDRNVLQRYVRPTPTMAKAAMGKLRRNRRRTATENQV
jgi:integrase